MVNWFCFSALCFNIYKSKDSNGDKLKYYRLPRENSKIQSQYKIFFQTDGFNWNDGHICTADWSTGEWKNLHDLPDTSIPEDQFEKIKQKYITVKNVKNKYKNPTQKIQSQYKKAKRRFEIAQQVISNSPRPITRSPMIRESSVVTPIRK